MKADPCPARAEDSQKAGRGPHQPFEYMIARHPGNKLDVISSLFSLLSSLHDYAGQADCAPQERQCDGHPSSAVFARVSVCVCVCQVGWLGQRGAAHRHSRQRRDLRDVRP